MLRKNQYLIKSKEKPTRNAKVTVQYIQPRQQMAISTTTVNHMLRSSTAEELEVENVEYLDSEELVEEHVGGVVKEEYENAFYPNAIHCLLDLYKDKNDNVVAKTKSDPRKFHAHMWRDIAKEMQERYFEFEADQIRQKYASLMQQYFEVKSLEDIENFEYFEKLHDIYKDPTIEMISKGGPIKRNKTPEMYKDENVMREVVCEEQPEEEPCTVFKREDIEHKEHEFIGMVKKELQEEEVHRHKDEEIKSAQREKSPKLLPEVKSENETHDEQKDLKRPFYETERLEEEPPQQKPKVIERDENVPSPPAVDDHSPDPTYSELMTLKQYNVEQERRHREQMDFLHKQFKQHQTTLDHLSYQLQELIKRLPSTS